MSFAIAFENVGIALLYFLPGYLLCKWKKAFGEHLPTLSALLIYIGTPALEINAFSSLKCTAENTWWMILFFIVTLALQCGFIAVVFLLFRKKRKDSRVRMTAIGSVMGNVGFFGMPIIRALLPNAPEVASYVAVFMLSMNILVFTVGAFCLTGKREYISLRCAFCNPTVIGFLIALPFYIFDIDSFLPQAVQNAITTVSSMTMPLCMFVLGVRLATKPLKTVIRQPVVYGISALKLLVFPVISYGIVTLLHLPYSFRAAILILCGTPCAAVILSLAELYNKETKLAADTLIVCTILSVLTIPLLSLLL